MSAYSKLQKLAQKLNYDAYEYHRKKKSKYQRLCPRWEALNIEMMQEQPLLLRGCETAFQISCDCHPKVTLDDLLKWATE